MTDRKTAMSPTMTLPYGPSPDAETAMDYFQDLATAQAAGFDSVADAKAAGFSPRAERRLETTMVSVNLGDLIEILVLADRELDDDGDGQYLSTRDLAAGVTWGNEGNARNIEPAKATIRIFDRLRAIAKAADPTPCAVVLPTPSIHCRQEA